MPKLVYIDEQLDARETMIVAVHLSPYFAAEDVETLEPIADIEEMIAAIESLQPEALITDYNLSEHKAGIAYTGAELVSKYQSRRKNFPCFVATGYAAKAASDAPIDVDINAIFPKESLESITDSASDEALPFFLRVKRKIEAYHAVVAAHEQDLQGLIRKMDAEALRPGEARRLLELDDELEAMLGGQSRVSPELKERALGPLTAIVSRAKKLVNELERLYPEDGSERGGDGAPS